MNYTYWLINLGSISIPFIFSFHKSLRFDRTWFAFWPACLISAFLFLVWDVLYTHWGVWGFTPKYLSGHYLANLPVEEVLFFICIPYACVFTYHCFKKLLPVHWMKKAEPAISAVLMIGLLLVGLLAIPKLYTAVTFLLLALFIAFVKWVVRPDWLHRFYLAWAVLLIPFFIVNGMLTGTGLAEQVVWYDDTQNLGIRMLTIPVEDTFYGMLLILLNVTLYEYFLERRKGKLIGD